jgi:putative copper export protein
MDAVIKASLYIGVILLLGAGVFCYFVASDITQPIQQRLRVGVWVGAFMVIVGTVLNLTQTVTNVLGKFDVAFVWEYTNATRHGMASYIRIGFMVLLVIVLLLRQHNRFLKTTFTLLGIGFLATFSGISHAASMSNLAMVADLAHFVAGSMWAGAVIYSAMMPIWSDQALTLTMKRVSSIGLVSVVLLVVTGVYTTLVHIGMTKAFFVSPYARVLYIKLAVILAILAIAAINRWHFVPKLLEKKYSFRRILAAEATLLIIVLALTGLLSVSALPHD